MAKGAMSGLPAVVINGTEAKAGETKVGDFLASLIGSDLSAENANAGLYRRAVIRHGKNEIFILANDKPDREFLDRFVSLPLVCEPSEESEGAIVLRPDPSKLMKPKGEDKFDKLELDDLLDMAARRGLPMPRNALRADVAKVLAVYEEDEKKALEMAQQVKAVDTKVRSKERKLKTGVSGGQMEATTSNEV